MLCLTGITVPSLKNFTTTYITTHITVCKEKSKNMRNFCPDTYTFNSIPSGGYAQ